MWDKYWRNKMVDVNPNIFVVILNVSEQDTLIKRQKL